MSFDVVNESVVNEKLVSAINAAKVVSFDFFDTLFVRPLYDPEDVFDLLGAKLGIDNFKAMRKEAQVAAFQRMHQLGDREITIELIYACFPCSTVGLSQADLVAAEYALELELVQPNPRLLLVFLDAIEAGKEVVITSDMYLPRSFFEQALKRHALPDVKVFISSCDNATKRDCGDLFDLVITHFGVEAANVLHIGDNQVSDIEKAKSKGVQTFLYTPPDKSNLNGHKSLSASIALGLRTVSQQSYSASSEDLGFVYGGPAALGFLYWIRNKAAEDKLDRVLFLSRDGYVLKLLADELQVLGLPAYDYFLGSRTAFHLASVTEQNFQSYIPFFLSGAEGLSPHEILDRIGVGAPSVAVMEQIGLSDNQRYAEVNRRRFEQFLYAYRWEILKVCRRNRRALFNYLITLGVKEGERVGFVDVGWSGSTQDAFECAIEPMFSLDVRGYYFCLAETPERYARSSVRNMSALFDASFKDVDIEGVYQNRVVIETFFTAPHDTIIGLEYKNSEVFAVEDRGRGGNKDSLAEVETLVGGILLFAQAYDQFKNQIDLTLTPSQLARPLVDFCISEEWKRYQYFEKMVNFDTWASTENKDIFLHDYS
ncbi:MAG: hypothetical protein WCY88_12085 [Spongiibacteraceae bacterium]